MDNKRFVYGRTIPLNSVDDLLPCITDNENENVYIRMVDIVNLLNSLNDENEQLKRDLEDYGDANATIESEILKLRKMNKQLRKQCFELEKDYLIETSDISDKIYLGDEIKELKQRYGVDV